MSNLPGRPLTGVVLPPEARGNQLQMPSDVPFGLGFLGAAKFGAIRTVIEARERALVAMAREMDARGAVAEAIIRKELAFEQLRNLDVLREAEADRIRETVALAKAKRLLEKLELDEKIAAAQARQTPSKPASTETRRASDRPSDYDQLVSIIRSIPGLVAEATRAKEDLLQRKGEGGLSDADQDLVDTIDAIVQGWVAKGAEGAAL